MFSNCANGLNHFCNHKKYMMQENKGSIAKRKKGKCINRTKEMTNLTKSQANKQIIMKENAKKICFSFGL